MAIDLVQEIRQKMMVDEAMKITPIEAARLLGLEINEPTYRVINECRCHELIIAYFCMQLYDGKMAAYALGIHDPNIIEEIQQVIDMQ